MISFALKSGKHVKPEIINDFSSIQLSETPVNADKLPEIHNYLIRLVKPANPSTVLEIIKNSQSKKFYRILGPLPIVRHFMFMAILSLALMMTISLSPSVDAKHMLMSMLDGQGWNQAMRLLFLASCASVGACFNALFKMNTYIVKNTFDNSLGFTYWARYVLGIVSGLLLSEFFVEVMDLDVISASENMTEDQPIGYIAKPILAILGGFSASLLYGILNRLVEAVESIFKGDLKETKEKELAALALQKELNIRQGSTQKLLELKQILMSSQATGDVISKVDEAIQTVNPSE